MAWEQLIITYGYWAIVLGTFCEGEMVLVLGGFLAHCGYLWLPYVILAAFCGSYAGDQCFYFLGRLRGARLLARHPRWQRRTERVLARLRRHQDLVTLGFRFCYGFRTITPMVIGLSGVGPWRFLLLNGIGAALWAVAVALCGYGIGQTAATVMGEIKQYERIVMAAILLLMLGLALFVAWRERAADRRAAPPSV